MQGKAKREGRAGAPMQSTAWTKRVKRVISGEFAPLSSGQVERPMRRVWVTFSRRGSGGRTRKGAGRWSISRRNERKRGRAETHFLGNVVSGIRRDVDNLYGAFGKGIIDIACASRRLLAVGPNGLGISPGRRGSR